MVFSLLISRKTAVFSSIKHLACTARFLYFTFMLCIIISGIEMVRDRKMSMKDIWLECMVLWLDMNIKMWWCCLWRSTHTDRLFLMVCVCVCVREYFFQCVCMLHRCYRFGLVYVYRCACFFACILVCLLVDIIRQLCSRLFSCVYI